MAGGREMTAQAGTNGGFSPRAILAGMIVTFVVSVVASGLLAAAIYLTPLTETRTGLWLYYIGVLSVALGGAYAAREARGLGWLHGGVCGLAYVLLALAAAGTLTGEPVFAGLTEKLLVAFAVGGIGGVLGVNL